MIRDLTSFLFKRVRIRESSRDAFVKILRDISYKPC